MHDPLYHEGVLLKPIKAGENGHRYYEEEEFLLSQIGTEICACKIFMFNLKFSVAI